MGKKKDKERQRALEAAQPRALGRVEFDGNIFTQPNIADLQAKWNNRARVDREVCGSLDLAYMRGVHAGYLEGYRDRRLKRKSKFPKV